LKAYYLEDESSNEHLKGKMIGLEGTLKRKG
jgi:hypothetical protein